MLFVKLCFLIVGLSSVFTTPAKDRRFLFNQSIKPPVNITKATYKAAVFNHQAVSHSGVSTRAQALEAMSRNLDIYEEQASHADEQNVDILVFPEDGIYGASFSRQSIKPFLETIPDPKAVNWNPCLNLTLVKGTEIQRRFSCMARNHSLYIVANMGDKQPCSSDLFHCPSDGQFQYNTDVVFDPNGKLIVRYHKRNLFFEGQFDYPQVELATFDTAFGRFAVFTCFDSIFKQPAIDVIEQYNVDSVAFPTLWVDIPPLFMAFEWQAAFAAGMNVNILAANHRTSGGSGIYTPTGPAVYVTDDKSAQLLIAKIPSRPELFPDSIQVSPLVNASSNGNSFQSYLFHDVYEFVRLEGRNGTVTVCHGTFCCQADFSKEDNNVDKFALGAFSGRHTYIMSAGVQACALVKCAGDSDTSCGQFTALSTTLFTKLVLKGNFSTKYVFPEIVLSEGYDVLLPGPRWTFSRNVLTSQTGFLKPLLTAVLLGREYSGDNQQV